MTIRPSVNRGRTHTISALLVCAAVLFVSDAAQAGFALVGPGSPSADNRQPTLPPAAAAPLDAPMPIVPSEPVTAEPLMPAPSAPTAQPVLTQSPEPVYIRRQKTSSLMKAPVNEPIDTSALLNATARNQEVMMVPPQDAPMPVPQAQPSNQRLVINPYPLQGMNSGATTAPNTNPKPFVDQAMIEGTGQLRPVAVPGQTGMVGMAERARVSARSVQDQGYLALPEKFQQQTSPAPMPVPVDTSMTPMPGGEVAPMNIGQPPAAAVVPSPPQATYADAVGFARDVPLPLALSQVVPPDYSYAFGPNINLGANVSWQGGKPWNQVLNDMLQSSGMVAVIEGRQVTIQKTGS